MVSTCPHCGKKLKTDNALVGKTGVCPRCRQRFTITESMPASPENSPQLKEAERASAPAPPVKHSQRSARKKLFVAAALTCLLVCAILVAGALYLYPQSQGPLTVYVVPVVDDIDGSIDQDWYFFYEQLRRWHDRYSVPGCFAFYPATMNNDQFNRIIAHMYDSENIELVLKGEDQYQGKRLDQMSSAEVLQALKSWQDKFVSELMELGQSDVQPPVAYNQLMMRLTEAIRDAAREAQFKICLEVGGSEQGFINMLSDFDITQYSVSLTKSGEAGPGEEFKTPEEVIQELLSFQNDYLIYINGIKVVPFLCSQQDFRSSEDSAKLDEGKWKTYTVLLRRAKQDMRIHLLTAREVYNLRHVTKMAL